MTKSLANRSAFRWVPTRCGPTRNTLKIQQRLPLLLILLFSQSAGVHAQATTASTHHRAHHRAMRTANRFCYLDDALDPYYVHGDFPKLTARQWTGDPHAEAVVVLAIDDMRDPATYEAYLRPILDRLKEVAGHAALSIMTNKVAPDHPQLATWIDEGVSIEIHTIDHPCPLLGDGDLPKAKSTYDRCVDLLSQIPNSRPVAFRMPCCDSLNTPSPRFYESIFASTSPQGNFLTIDTSVFTVSTDDDATLSARQTTDADGRPKFQKYLPFPSFVNTIKNYPFPYLIGDTCWQFPCIVPSDWEAQNLHQPNNPKTVDDMRSVLDIVVQKQGVMNLVFHPHGWIRADQIVQLIDHAAKKHGRKVRFMSFREAQQNLDKHLLDGQPVRTPSGAPNGVRLADVDQDGYQDVLRLDPQGRLTTRIWRPDRQVWDTNIDALDAVSIHLGVVRLQEARAAKPTTPAPKLQTRPAATVLLARTSRGCEQYVYQNRRWSRAVTAFQKMAAEAGPDVTAARLRDVDHDGSCELLVQSPQASTAIYRWHNGCWQATDHGLPDGVNIVRADGGDAGLRWVDLDHDGRDECLFSDARRYSAHRLSSLTDGWKKILVGTRNVGTQQSDDAPTQSSDEPTSDAATDSDSVSKTVIPPFIRSDGSNNGVWAHSEHLWWQNEHTARLPDNVERLPFTRILPSTNKTNARTASTGPVEQPFPKATEPTEAVATFRSAAGVSVQLVAAEPLVNDPVAFDWGPDGRLWVAEMRDYPDSDDGSIRGRVKVLFDDDQDGVFDRSSIYLDGIDYPTGVKAWHDGVLVSGAPDLVFAQDTDGDLRADRRTVLYRGFTEGNQQHRANGMRWGFDNWLYLANGDSGGEIESVATGQKVRINGRDLRIRPDTGELETVSGQTQFGRSRDEWGNWFGGNNSNPIWHYVLKERYVRRNTHFAPPAIKQPISDFPGPAPVFPASTTLPRFNDFDRANRFTSACSPLIVRNFEDRGEEPVGAGTVDAFVCEPVHNLVQRERVRREGVTFRSSRLPGEREAEFLSSTDSWFRPVMARLGPAGAIWVADMYRLVIEHPEWIPQTWQDKLDVRDGHDRGRIYRVWPRSADRRQNRPVPRMKDLSVESLVASLSHRTAWRRDMAQQLLIWRNDERAVPLLRQMIVDERGIACIYAAHTLSALGQLDNASIVQAMTNHAGRVSVTEDQVAALCQLVALAESRLEDSPELLSKTLDLVAAHDARNTDQVAHAQNRSPVLLQVACSLGYVTDVRAARALAKIASIESADPWIQSAVLSSLTEQNVGEVLREVAAMSSHATSFVRSLTAQAMALGDRATQQHAMELLARGADGQHGVFSDQDAWKADALADVIEQYRRRHQAKPVDGLPDSTRKLLDHASAVARSTVTRPQTTIDTQLACLSLLRDDIGNSTANRHQLVELLHTNQPTQVQAKAASVLLKQFDEDGLQPILSRWLGLSHRVRNGLLDEILSRTTLTQRMLEYSKAESIDLQLDARRRQQLMASRDDQIRAAAKKLFATSASPSARATVVDRYATEIAGLDGDAARGRKTFERVCATCHRLSNIGYAVGPDLSPLAHKSTEFMLTAVLDPNRAVESTYVDYVLNTEDGRSATGILQSETAVSVTLLGPEAKSYTVLRNAIQEVRASGRSLMPEGLEKDVVPQQMADLLAFLRSHRASPKSLAGNAPQVAPVRDDGSIRLLAMHAEIYGPSLVFEAKHQNLGYWSSESDFAVWTVDSKKGGVFRVVMDHACDAASAGNFFEIACDDQTIGDEVKSTGSWDSYQTMRVGQLVLPPGRSQITLRSAGPVNSYLMDMHQLILYPK